MLTVIRQTDKRWGTSVLWECRCDCGGSILAVGYKLRNGRVKSCGCYRKRIILEKNTVDLTGRQFGRLTVISKADEMKINRDGSQRKLWKCSCICGKTKITNTTALTSDSVSSCGCIRKEPPVNFNNLVGRRFGRLTVISRGVIDKKYQTRWLCRCDCGMEKSFLAADLVRGLTQSCGCLRQLIYSGMNCRFYQHGRTGTEEFNHERRAKRRSFENLASIEPIPVGAISHRMRVEFEGKCIYCNDPYEAVDHLTPLSKGGLHALWNLVPACTFCNSSKKDRLLGSGWWPKAWNVEVSTNVN